MNRRSYVSVLQPRPRTHLRYVERREAVLAELAQQKVLRPKRVTGRGGRGGGQVSSLSIVPAAPRCTMRSTAAVRGGLRLVSPGSARPELRLHLLDLPPNSLFSIFVDPQGVAHLFNINIKIQEYERRDRRTPPGAAVPASSPATILLFPRLVCITAAALIPFLLLSQGTHHPALHFRPARTERRMAWVERSGGGWTWSSGE